MGMPELPIHPEPWAYRWTEEELRTIREYGEACAKAEREACAKVCDEIEAAAAPSEAYVDGTAADCAAAIRARQ